MIIDYKTNGIIYGKREEKYNIENDMEITLW